MFDSGTFSRSSAMDGIQLSLSMELSWIYLLLVLGKDHRSAAFVWILTALGPTVVSAAAAAVSVVATATLVAVATCCSADSSALNRLGSTSGLLGSGFLNGGKESICICGFC